jgi:hypothetical protein
LALLPDREEVLVNFGFMVSLVVLIVGILAIFITIPIASTYAFWFVVAAYVILAGTRG